jgi:pSer/pThr/pTyr-binding forkhead associated (FHA) protein
MRCSECGQTNLPGALFCEQCGADLDVGAGASIAPPTADDLSEHVAAPPPEVETPAPADASATGDVPAPVDAPPPLPTRLCPSCGHPNDLAFKICEACGASLEAPQAPAHQAPAPPAAAAAVPDDLPARRIEPVGGVPAAPPPPSLPSVEGPTQYMGLTPGQLVTGPQKGKVKLVVEQGMVVGKQFLLTGDQMLVGREDATEQLYPEIDLTGLDEGYVHRRHAQLAFEGTFLFVTHLGGHNRTYVNNRPIADRLPHPLNIGDTVRFGKVVLRVTEA